MKHLDLYSRSLQHKREAHAAMLTVATDLELCTSTADVRSVWEEYGAKENIGGNWLNFMTEGVLVQLNITTMTLMCNKGGGVAATARYLLPMSLQDACHEVATERNYKS